MADLLTFLAACGLIVLCGRLHAHECRLNRRR
jgi:hypothetical protein